jgi:hypothetical protein
LAQTRTAAAPEWTFEETGERTVVRQGHTVVLDERWPSLLGPGATVEDARRRVRRQLSAAALSVAG